MNPALWWLLGGLVVAGGTVAVIASKPKEDPGPAPFLDPNVYFKDITEQTSELAAIGASRDAESNARVASWRKAAKEIPVIGDYAGYLIDLGQWLGKVLGSNYAEQLELTVDGVTAVSKINGEIGVNWLFSFLSADKRKSYCLYEAKNADAIVAAARRANLPADVIIEVSQVDPERILAAAA